MALGAGRGARRPGPAGGGRRSRVPARRGEGPGGPRSSPHDGGSASEEPVDELRRTGAAPRRTTRVAVRTRLFAQGRGFVGPEAGRWDSGRATGRAGPDAGGGGTRATGRAGPEAGRWVFGRAIGRVGPEAGRWVLGRATGGVGTGSGAVGLGSSDRWCGDRKRGGGSLVERQVVWDSKRGPPSSSLRRAGAGELGRRRGGGHGSRAGARMPVGRAIQDVFRDMASSTCGRRARVMAGTRRPRGTRLRRPPPAGPGLCAPRRCPAPTRAGRAPRRCPAPTRAGRASRRPGGLDAAPGFVVVEWGDEDR